jgi:hypothetical protein
VHSHCAQRVASLPVGCAARAVFRRQESGLAQQSMLAATTNGSALLLLGQIDAGLRPARG